MKRVSLFVLSFLLLTSASASAFPGEGATPSKAGPEMIRGCDATNAPSGSQCMARPLAVDDQGRVIEVPSSGATETVNQGTAGAFPWAFKLFSGDDSGFKAKVESDGSVDTKVTNFPATQPVSAASLPLPSGAATDASLTNGNLKSTAGVELLDSGGTNKASISAGGALKVDNSGVTQPSNTSQVGGNTVLTGNGATGNGSQRVTIANDNSPVPVSGTVSTNPSPATDRTATGSLGALNATVTMSVAGLGGVGFDVRSIGSETIIFEATVDGTNWWTLTVYAAITNAAVTSTTTNGQWVAGVSGLASVRMRVSGYTSGGPATGVIEGNQALSGSTQPIIPYNTAGTAATNAGPTDSAVPGSTVAATAYVGAYNGTNWDRLRTPKVFTPQNAVSINAEATIWTPASGKKFRLMGYCLQASVAGNVVLKDNTGGTTIMVVPAAAGGSCTFQNLGNGILSAAANNVLTATGPATSTLSGYVSGTEE